LIKTDSESFTTESISESTSEPFTTESTFIINPNSFVQQKLATCFLAIQCLVPESCAISQETCLELNQLDSLPFDTRTGLAECKVESLLCTLKVRTKDDMGECNLMYRECAEKIGVTVKNNMIIGYNLEEKITNKTKENIEHLSKNELERVVNNILLNITQNISNQLGHTAEIEVISINNDSTI
jgi:hypothetical protein